MSSNAFNFQVPFPVDRVTVRRKRYEDAPEGHTDAEAAPLPPRETLETLYDGSYDAGFRAGRRQAFEEMAASRATEIREVKGSIRQLESVLQGLIDVAEGHFPELIMSALGRLFREHQFTQEEVANEVAALLREVSQAQSILVESSVGEIGQLEARIERLGLSLQHGRVQWKGNPTLEKGEYILQTDLGMVDGRRHSKLAQVRMALET